MKKRILPAVERLEALISKYADEWTARNKAKAFRDRQIRAAREKYEEVLLGRDATILKITENAAKIAEKNPSVFGRDRKSVALTHGVIGFRDQPARVAIRPSMSEDEAIQNLIDSGLEKFIRYRPELNRSAILQADRDDIIRLAENGVSIEKACARFFIKPKY